MQWSLHKILHISNWFQKVVLGNHEKPHAMVPVIMFEYTVHCIQWTYVTCTSQCIWAEHKPSITVTSKQAAFINKLHRFITIKIVLGFLLDQKLQSNGRWNECGQFYHSPELSLYFQNVWILPLVFPLLDIF